MVFALHAGLGALLEEGLEGAWARHAACGRALAGRPREARASSSWPPPSTACPSSRRCGFPDDLGGLSEADVRAALLHRYGIEIGAGVGVMAGRVWRIGCMGHTARPRNVELLLGALGEVLGR